MKSKFLRWAIRILLLIALSFFIYYSYFYSKVTVGDSVPDFDFVTITQKNIRTLDLKNQTYILHFFSRDCGICMKELPFMIRFALENKEKMRVYFIHEGSTAVDLAAISEIFSGKIDPDNIMADDWHAADTFGVVAVPTTFIIGSDGYVIKKITGSGEEDLPKAASIVR